MSYDIEQYESLALWIGLAILFFFIGMAIQDVLKRGKVPLFGRIFVWIVLFTGCAGFIAKGIIQFIYETQGLG